MTRDELLRWLAIRHLDGLPIGTSVLMAELGLSAREAQLAMGVGWLRFVEAERSRREALSRCRFCGQAFSGRGRGAQSQHERLCEQDAAMPSLRPVEVPPEVCPRCGCELIKNHDERECLVHGTVYTPARAWDASDWGVAPLELGDGKSRRRGASRARTRAEVA